VFDPRSLLVSHKVKGATIVARTKEEKGTHYVLSRKDRTVVSIKLKKIGPQLTHQLDPDLPTTNFSTYLIELESKDCSSRKKQGHEMRGVLLTFIFYLVLSDSTKKLAYTMEPTILSEYVKYLTRHYWWRHFSTSQPTQWRS